ncbi:NADP-dependent alcohol dehydrogenase adhC [Gymnopus androsaceus JB14]|uniref:NADP-dependent alcohol dehydrogenase adhC n=1 Tax=Gymnopus androsaceus JB14 TaxID=1447944 RepID=A0A6A4I8R4_9AGAR|nr:NADP-dependent alcohol dehydrogenase adhC [Gymnopus androsaceus JB14]
MSKTVNAWAATSPHILEPITIERREPDDNDVAIDIKFAGICHSDLHTAKGEWGETTYPLVPGHEIAGVVAAVGKNVRDFKVGDHVGVGCMVNSCRTCDSCKDGEEQYCLKGNTLTYNAKDPKEEGKITQGGYSNTLWSIRPSCCEFLITIPMNVAAPLLCAGITVYSPLKHWGMGPGKKVGVIGLGGLGHMAVKIAKAMGAEVTVFSQTLSKKDLGIKMGADNYYATSDRSVFEPLKQSLDLIINTVSSKIPLTLYLTLLRRDSTLVEIGMPEEPLSIAPFVLAAQRVGVFGSMIGGIRETQEMLDFCGEKQIFPEVETIPASYINEAYERFRFVIDISSMESRAKI